MSIHTGATPNIHISAHTWNNDGVWIIIHEKQVFRPNEDVDINVMSNGGYIVGYVAPGEYLRYTVQVTKKGAWL